MQTDLELRDSSDYDELAEASGKFEHDFIAKLKIHDENEVEEEEEDEEEDEEEEFSFVLVNPDGSPITADDAFDNGQIRPIYPVFDQNLLLADESDGPRSPVKKVFVQQKGDSPSEGTYCEWSPKTAVKSNSTGSSKVWKLRDVKLRSSSDGKDAFVFLNPAAEKASSGGAVMKKVKGKTTTSSSSAHEKHYVSNRAKKESDKRKSYLPYRQDLFGGFFASTSGMSRNVHPY